MAYQLDGNVTDDNDVPVAGALVYVYDYTGRLADLTDSLGQDVKQPLTTDEIGYWAAFVAPSGFYTLKYWWGDRLRYIEAGRPIGEEALAGGVILGARDEAVTAQLSVSADRALAQIAAAAAIAEAEDIRRANIYRTGIATADKAALDALTGPFTEGDSGAVYADGTAANNGIYSYTSGAWAKVADFPDVAAAEAQEAAEAAAASISLEGILPQASGLAEVPTIVGNELIGVQSGGAGYKLSLYDLAQYVASNPAAPPIYELLLIAGQSNAMAAGVTNPIPTDIAAIDPARVKIWNGSAFVGYVAGTNSEPTGVLASKWGPEAQYAVEWCAANPTGTLYIVKRAVSGTAITTWAPGGSGANYTNMTTWVNAGKAALDGAALSYSTNVIWAQGESEAQADQTTANAYQGRLTTLLAGMHADWGASRIAISRVAPNLTYSSTIQDAQNYVAVNDSLAYLTNTDDLTQVDGLHYDSASMATIGSRAFDAIANGISVEVADTTPNAFTFTDATNVDPSTVAISNQITVAGINAPVVVTITGGEYSKNGGAYTSATGVASLGDTFRVRHTSSASGSTATNTTLTIGGVSDTFTSTTVASGTYTFANSEASDLVARITVAPTSGRKAAIDTLVGSLKSAGVWTKLDALYVLAAADSQAAKLNWKSTSYNATEVSAPTFTADRGFTGNGTSAYLDTGFNPATASTPNFAQNSAHISFWSRTSGQGAAQDMGTSGSSLSLLLRNTSDQALARVNNTGGTVRTVTDASGFFLASRTGATGADGAFYRNGTSLGTLGAGSAAVVSANIRILGITTPVYSARECAAATIGGGLTSGEVTALYNALDTYLASVGAA